MNRRSAGRIALLSLALLVGGMSPRLPIGVVRVAPASAQEASTTSPVGQTAPATSSGLPRRPPDPRTLREYWPVFAALSLSWAGIVAYLISLGRPFGRAARAIHDLDGERSAR